MATEMNNDQSQNDHSHNEHSVSQYIDGLKVGDELATQKIWERFLDRLIRLADKKLKSKRQRVDEEDVVQVAFAQFFRQVQEGRFSKINDRNDLWQILAMLVDRRAKDQDRRQRTEKAGNGQVRNESIFMEKSDLDGIAGVPEMVPTPELAVEMMEVFRNRLADLNDEKYEQIALLKMQGYSTAEIAQQLKSSTRTIERRLEKIREIWSSRMNE